VLGAPIQVPFGPVEVTMVHRTGGEAAVAEPPSPAPLDSDAEQLEQRMLNHLVRHMQTGGESEEATAELLPMPTEEPPAATASNQPACPFGTENLAAPGWQRSAAPQAASGKKHLPYFGQYNAAIDCENHLTLPAEVHEMLGSPRPRVLYVTPGISTLWLYTQAGLRNMLESPRIHGLMQDIDINGRIFLSNIRRVEVHADGSMELPADLVRKAGLEGMPVMIFGVDDHLEIWDRCRWEDYTGTGQPTLNDLTDILGKVLEHVIGNLPFPLEINVDACELNQRMQEALNPSKQCPDAEPDWYRIKFEDEPSHLNPQRITGGIQ
jgi:DNA-binding transcriptional regulator/RsmH inhibitor MraZ